MRVGSDRVHLVGVGGAGMSAMARLLYGLGAELTGSDRDSGPVVEELRAEGLLIWTGHRPDAVSGEYGYVIRSAAVPETDAEVAECVRRGYTSLLYAESVGRLSEGKRTVAIAGTHGKTTTTALVVAALRGAGLDPSHLVGGEVPELGGNGYAGKDDLLVVEACEFNRSFLSLRPTAAAILNLDHDHIDCYPELADFHAAFAEYVGCVRPGGTVLVEESVPAQVLDEAAGEVRTRRVGSGLFADIRALEVQHDRGLYSFVPMVSGRRLPRVQLGQPGRFQISNALFALGLAEAVGAEDLAGACEGLSSFTGVRRRFELHTCKSGASLVLDYAHHPAELQAVLRAARKYFPGRPVCAVFQPHQHSRTRHLFADFARVLASVDLVLIPPIYAAREDEATRQSVTHEDLALAVREADGRCEAVDSLGDVAQRIIARRGPADVIMVLGAGDIDGILDELIETL